MIVVADASPIHYLVLIDEIAILQAVFDRVLLPHAVYQELQHSSTPAKVRQWAQSLPSWVEVHTVRQTMVPTLSALDAGERDAIQLALERGIHTILIDETDGRRQAEMLNLEVRGTLRVLEDGASLRILDFRTALSKLRQTNFRMSPALVQMFLNRNR